MKYFKKALILWVILVVGGVLFLIFGVNAKSFGKPYTQNCTDLVNEYVPCQVQNVEYGFPFKYAKGQPLAPGNLYSKEDTNIAYLFANAVVWILPLPLLYGSTIVSKKMRRT